MAVMAPAIPAILAFAGTVVQAATQPGPPKPPNLKPKEKVIDHELRDARARQLRQPYGADHTLLGDSLGSTTLVGA